ncbi:MAG: armadillo/beta-catenin-like repeat-containing protein [Planctomycetes bacterium]|nr:armadillo/beta-catenin-like repeat-containing protein [Planctomycetota bacterium]
MGLFDRFKKKAADGLPSAELRVLVADLGSGDVARMTAACHALERIGPPAQAAVPALMELLHHDDGDLCNAAAAALSSIERSLA